MNINIWVNEYCRKFISNLESNIETILYKTPFKIVCLSKTHKNNASKDMLEFMGVLLHQKYSIAILL